MRSATFSFLLGILIVQTCHQLPTIHGSFFLLPLVGLVVYARTRWFGFFVLGVLWTIWRAQIILSQELPAVLEGQDVVVIGEIIDLPVKRDDGWHFLFAPTTLTFQGKNATVPKRLRLAWYVDKRKQSPLPALSPGQQWLFTVRLKRARSTLNPGVFDYSQWSFQQGIRALGYVRERGEYRLLKQSAWQIDSLRYHILHTMQQVLGKRESTGMLIALVLGSNAAISQSQRDVLQRTGIMHLMVISGSHIALIATLTFLLAQWFWRYIGVRWLPPMQFAALLSILAAFSYALLAGFSVPTQRALIMLSIFLFSILLPRIVSPSHRLSLALLLVLIYDPLAVLNTGFWFSFGIVAALLYAYSRINQQNSSYLARLGVGMFKTQIIATLASLPIVLYSFGYMPLTTFVANAIAIPWVSFVIVPFTLISAFTALFSPVLGNFSLNFTADLLEALWVSMTWLAHLPISTWYNAQVPLWALCSAGIGLFVLLLPPGFPGRWLGVIGYLPLFFLPISTPKVGEVWFTLLDIGQGLAAVVRTQHHVLVYDTGLAISEEMDSGETVVVPFLQRQGIRKIDTVIVSHNHDDHSGGARSVVEKLPVAEVLTSDVKMLTKMLEPFENIYPCRAGQQWQWDGVHFQMLHPAKNFLTYIARENNYSCVLKISTANHAILLTGDIQGEAELYLTKHYARELSSAVMLVPHHGSKTSSSADFLKAINPTLAIVSTGYLNLWRFPNTDVVQRYANHGISLLNTAETGAITVHFTTTDVPEANLARESMRRYWHE